MEQGGAGGRGAARRGSPRARAPLARAVRLHRGRRTQPGPARAPRAGCARLAATWRVSGWSRSSSVFAPLRFLLLVLLLLSPNPPHHPGLCAASFPGFRGPRQGRQGRPAAFNLTLRLGSPSPGAVDQLGAELRSGSGGGEEQKGGKSGLWVLDTDLPRCLLSSLVSF